MKPWPRNAPLTVEYFKERSEVDANGCWVWQGPRRRGKYGVMGWRGIGTSAHRVCYQVVNDIILPMDIFVCHTCDNPPCVNPDHLFPGSSEDNARDAMKKGRHTSQVYGVPRGGEYRSKNVGTDNPQAKLNPEAITLIRASHLPKKVIARQFGVDPKTIRQILRREIWAHVP